ncbi:MAG TPA: hypothetical protein VLA05_08000 [Coriobacteriia bacterium]|nr:hypothetical protein [Coriobacteriia bacterium]
MSATITVSDDSIVVSGRTRPSRGVVTGFAVAGVLSVVLGLLIAFWWRDVGDGIGFGYAAAIPVACLLWASFFAFGNEFIVVRGRQLRHELRVLGVPVWHGSYDLLRVRGLLSPSTDCARVSSLVDMTRSVSSPAPRLKFWYETRIESVGWSLSSIEADMLAAELLSYESRLRESLHLAPYSSLSDMSVWTPERMSLIGSGLVDSEADRRGRFIGP